MTGLIILDKPENITSFSAVARVRRIADEKKAGHTGTLDPMATGVLPVLLGGATRFSELLPTRDKGYRAKIRLGLTTDTLDITGKVLSTSGVKATAADFEKVLKSFEGSVSQLPPMYSAVSKNGVRLYELARKGIEVEREARTVEIFSADLLACDEAANEYEIEVMCSAGTYIRSLAADIGFALGCGAVLTGLRRTLANGFRADECVTLEQLEAAAMEGGISAYLLSVDNVLGSYPEVRVTPAQAIRFKNGGELDINRLKTDGAPGFYRVYADNNEFLGVGEIQPGGEQMTVKRVYNADPSLKHI